MSTSELLFIIPRVREDGFQASIRGHMLDLVDPGCGTELAPTPEDLYVASHASQLAWSAREFLRTHGLPDEVNVTAAWHRRGNSPSVLELHLTVTVSNRVKDVGDSLKALLQTTPAAGSPAERVVRVAFE
jgi:uncharacterized OsmC-like protein